MVSMILKLLFFLKLSDTCLQGGELHLDMFYENERKYVAVSNPFKHRKSNDK